MLPSSANQETNTQIQPIKIYPRASPGLNPDNDGELEWIKWMEQLSFKVDSNRLCSFLSLCERDEAVVT